MIFELVFCFWVFYFSSASSFADGDLKVTKQTVKKETESVNEQDKSERANKR